VPVLELEPVLGPELELVLVLVPELEPEPGRHKLQQLH
jgi:hypothetical protein